jgi:hypothetical protein
MSKPRILTVTATGLDRKRADFYTMRNVPLDYIKGKYFYAWIDDHIVKHRFLGYCVNQYAIRIATLKEDRWTR